MDFLFSRYWISSKGSLLVQQYVGPGGEKLDRLVNLTVKVSTEQHGGNDILS